jgi:Helix-turn-helix domain
MQKETVKARIREAAEWPSARELAEEYGVSHRFVRWLIERGQLEVVRLNVIRVNPESFEAYVTMQNE